MIEFVVWLIGSFSALFGFVVFYAKLTNANDFLNFKFVLLFFLGILFLSIIYYFNITYLGMISYFLVCPLVYLKVNYTSFKKFIFYTLIIWIYGMVLDLIIMAFTSLALHLYNVEDYWFIFECIISVIISIMLVILAYNKKLKKFTTNLYERIFNVKYFDVSLLLFSAFVLVASIIILLNLDHLNVSIFSIVFVLMLIAIFGLLIKYHINAKENEIFLKTLKENNDFYIKMEDENRIFRHNLNAKLLSIKSVSNVKSKSLLEELLKENNHNENYVNIVDVIPYGLNGIIYEKIYPYLNEIDIKIDNQIDYDIFAVLSPRRYNVLVEKIVIALDNAIEACGKSDEKALIIHLYNEDKNVIVEIENTFSGAINFEDLGNIGYSTKGKKRGLGLFSSIRNNEASLSIKIINNLFIAKIKAKKKIDN